MQKLVPLEDAEAALDRAMADPSLSREQRIAAQITFCLRAWRDPDEAIAHAAAMIAKGGAS
jgi:hypothetical protein